MEQVCAVCDAKAPHRCASCLSVWYCSSEHQREHWKLHQKNCSFFKIVEDSELGKGFIATRDIKPGTIILEEKPVACAASNAPPNSCVTCGLICGGERRSCSSCNWPVCSVECEKLPIHSENECQIFASQKVSCDPLTFGFGWSPQDLVMGIRVGLLQRKDPLMYKKVLQLCSEYSLPEKYDMSGVVATLRYLLGGIEGLEFVLGEVAKLLRIFQINCFTNSPQNCYNNGDLFGAGKDVCRIIALYLQSSRLNHSCIPNCHWVQVSKPEWKIRIKTTREVKKGEALTVFYWLGEIENPTHERQWIIKKYGNFQCKCTRCKDPTELGTYISGVVCEICQENKSLGYYLPVDPLNLNNDAIWKCNRCGGSKSTTTILRMVDKYDLEIRSMRWSRHDNVIDSCKSFVNETSGIIFHPNHFVIQRAMGVAFKFFINYPGTSSIVELIKYLIQCSKHLLSIQSLLAPGITPGRAILQDSMAFYYQLHAQLSQGNDDQFEIFYEESLVLLKEALKFFKTELPMPTGEVTRAMSIEENITDALDILALCRLKRLNASASHK